MTPRTLLRFLIGDSEAIFEIADDRSSLWVGGLLVLTAGIARDYDGEDLVHQPWRLLIPFGASLLASFVLFDILYVIMLARGTRRPSYPAGYRSFLSLFWMTAPLAWLYAIPYDRMFDAVTAIECHLWTLAVVAAWRVILMIRCVSVLMNVHPACATFFVLAVADVLAIVALMNSPAPILEVMGVIRMTDSERIVSHATLTVMLLSFLSAPVWGIGALASLFQAKPIWSLEDTDRPATPHRGMRWLLGGVLAFWCGMLLVTQPAQIRKHRVLSLYAAKDISGGLAELSAHQRSDYPPNWELPHGTYDADPPMIYEVMEAVIRQPPAPWVREQYLEAFKEYLDRSPWLIYGNFYGEDELPRVVLVLQGVPEGPEIADQLLKTLHISKVGLSPQALERLQTLERVANPPAAVPADGPVEGH